MKLKNLFDSAESKTYTAHQDHYRDGGRFWYVEGPDGREVLRGLPEFDAKKLAQKKNEQESLTEPSK